MNEKYADYLSVLVLTLLILGFCQDLVINGEAPFYRDLTNYFYPLRYSLYESYRAGALPLWDRHFAQGFPNLAAFQTGVFYPPHLIFAFATFFLSIRALFIFHFLIAAIGTYGLLRHWNYSRGLALVGSLLFALGGVIVSLSNLLNHFQSAVWLPCLILTWERALLTPTWCKFITFTLVGTLQFLAGSPELFTMSMGLALLDGFRIRDSQPEVSVFRIFYFVLGANLLTVALTMAQLLPTAELIMESRRSQPIDPAEGMMWSLEPSNLLNLFFLDREVEPSFGVGINFFFGQKVPLLLTHYMGVACLFGILLWIYYGTRREKIYISALTLGSLAMALGSNAIIYPYIFRHLPIISAIRFPEKFFFLTYVLLFLMAMRGLKGLLLDRRKKKKAPTIILWSIALAWLGVYLVLRFYSEALTDFIVAHSRIQTLSDIHLKATVSVLTNLQQQVILSFALLILLILVKSEKIGGWVFSILLVSVVYVDLAWANRDFLFTAHPDKIDRTPPVFQPSEPSRTRFFFYPAPNDLHPAFFSVNGRPSFEQAVALSFQNYLPNVGTMWGIDYFQEIDALSRRPYNEFLKVANKLDFEHQLKLLRTFNVGHIVSYRELTKKGLHLIGKFPKSYSWLYSVNGAMPRAYIVNRALVEKEPFKALQRLSTPKFDPSREVVLANDISIQPAGALITDVKFLRYDNTIVTIHAEANQDGVFILADSFYPGWKAFIDGQETKIYRANHFFRALALPKGQHRIEFRYDPLSFRLGLVISSLTLTILAVLSVYLFLRQRKFAARHSFSPAQVSHS